jgi:hypothetical protein
MKQANATATTRAAANKILWLNFMFRVMDELPQRVGSTKGGANATDVVLRCIYVDRAASKIRRIFSKVTKCSVRTEIG